MQQFISTLLQAIQKIGQHIKPIRNFYKILEVKTMNFLPLNGSNVALQLNQILASYDVNNFINIGGNSDINFGITKTTPSILKINCSVNFLGLQNPIFIGIERSGPSGTFSKKYIVNPVFDTVSSTWNASVSFCEIYQALNGDNIGIQLYDVYNNNSQPFDITDGCVELELKNLM